MSNSDRLTGPDFLDSVADQSAAQGLPVNAAEFRQRATDWRADQARIEQLEADLARLERQLRSDTERARILDKLKTHLQAADEALAWPPPADAEPKTLPVPTHVYLTDKAAVIVGDPQRGWDEEAPGAHNCDAMRCASIGPHVLARVPFTDERPVAQQQRQAVAWADEWRAAVAAKLSSYGLSEEAAAVFASSELDEYKAGLCDCAENDPVDMVDLMMGVARDAIEKWKIESAGRPFGHKNTAPPPSVPEQKKLHVGNLPSLTDSEYPGLGDWWVQLWDEDKVFARAFGASPEEARRRAEHIRDALAQQPAAGDRAYPTPRNRAEAVALARLALAHLGVIDAHIDAAIARCETNSATQHQEPKS